MHISHLFPITALCTRVDRDLGAPESDRCSFSGYDKCAIIRLASGMQKGHRTETDEILLLLLLCSIYALQSATSQNCVCTFWLCLEKITYGHQPHKNASQKSLQTNLSEQIGANQDSFTFLVRKSLVNPSYFMKFMNQISVI